MNRSSLSFVLVSALALGTVGWVVSDAGTEINFEAPPIRATPAGRFVPAAPPEKVVSALEQGRAEADAEVAAGRPTMYTYGLRSALVSIDRQTGLPYKGIAGCIVSQEIFDRAKGHNDRILELTAQRGALPGSLKPWMNEVMHPKAAFETLAKTQTPTVLKVGGPAAVVPDGRTTVRAVVQKFEAAENRVVDLVLIDVRPDGGDPGHGPPPLGELAEGSPLLVWGPKGSGYAVLKAAVKGARPGADYHTLDLRRGGWIHVEPGASAESF